MVAKVVLNAVQADKFSKCESLATSAGTFLASLRRKIFRHRSQLHSWRGWLDGNAVIEGTLDTGLGLECVHRLLFSVWLKCNETRNVQKVCNFVFCDTALGHSNTCTSTFETPTETPLQYTRDSLSVCVCM